MKNTLKLLVASGDASPDMRYATGLSTPDEFIWFGTDRESGVVMSALEYSRARSQVRSRVRVYAEAELGRSRLEILAELLRRFDAAGFVVPAEFPLGLAEKMRSAGLTVRPVDGCFFPAREFKSEPEAAAVAAALRGAEAGLERAVGILRESGIGTDGSLIWEGAPLTSERLRSEIDVVMLRLGLLPTGTICAGGRQSAQPHHQGSGVLYANAPIVMDIFPRSGATGYWGDLTRTVVKGRPSDELLRMYDAVLAAREFGKEKIRIGAVPAEIHRAAASVLESAGFRTGRSAEGDFGFFHGLGHGVGLDIHEAPRLSPRNEIPLRGGEMITVEPGLYYPGLGGIRLEDLVWLAPDGAVHTLTRAPDFFTVD